MCLLKKNQKLIKINNSKNKYISLYYICYCILLLVIIIIYEIFTVLLCSIILFKWKLLQIFIYSKNKYNFTIDFIIFRHLCNFTHNLQKFYPLYCQFCYYYHSFTLYKYTIIDNINEYENLNLNYILIN